MSRKKTVAPSSLRLLTQHAYDVVKYVNEESQNCCSSELKELINVTLTNLDQINFELTHLTINENTVAAHEFADFDMDKNSTH